MQRQRQMVGVISVLILLSGCLSGPVGGDAQPTTSTSVVTPTGTPTTHATDTTSATANCKELDTQDHPTPPETLTQETALQFVEEYINITAWNTGIESSDWKYQRVSTTAKGYIVNSTNNGYVIHIIWTFGEKRCNGAVAHGKAQTDLFINESILVANGSSILQGSPGHYMYNKSNHKRLKPDIILTNGTVVERWNES